MSKTKLDPYGEPWKPSKGRIDVPKHVKPQPRLSRPKVATDSEYAATVLVWFWYEGRLWQKPPAFREWAHEWAFKEGRRHAGTGTWLTHDEIKTSLATIPPEPERKPPEPVKPTEREGFEGAVADRLPDAFQTTMHGIVRTTESVEGHNVNDTAEMVDLTVAFGPVLPNPVTDEGGWPRCTRALSRIPVPQAVERRADGTYHLACAGSLETMPVSETALKVMRARYLLVRGFYQRHLNVMAHGERQEVVARFFPGGAWTPKPGSELAKLMGVVG